MTSKYLNKEEIIRNLNLNFIYFEFPNVPPQFFSSNNEIFKLLVIGFNPGYDEKYNVSEKKFIDFCKQKLDVEEFDKIIDLYFKWCYAEYEMLIEKFEAHKPKISQKIITKLKILVTRQKEPKDHIQKNTNKNRNFPLFNKVVNTYGDIGLGIQNILPYHSKKWFDLTLKDIKNSNLLKEIILNNWREASEFYKKSIQEKSIKQIHISGRGIFQEALKNCEEYLNYVKIQKTQEIKPDFELIFPPSYIEFIKCESKSISFVVSKNSKTKAEKKVKKKVFDVEVYLKAPPSFKSSKIPLILTDHISGLRGYLRDRIKLIYSNTEENVDSLKLPLKLE